MPFWYQFKLWLEIWLGLSPDALHVLVGAALHLGAAALFGWRLDRWRPWLLVLALLAANEVSDLWVEIWPDLARQLMEAWKDVVLTMAVPTMVMLAARYRPDLFTASVASDD